jgi:hypothetical protein
VPTAEHESPIALAKLDPDLVPWLLTNVFEVKVPDYDHARVHATDVRVMVPATYHADGMLLYCDAADKPQLAAVMEVQRNPDNGKRRMWKLYVAQLEVEQNVSVVLVVFCPDPTLAAWYRRLLEPDGSSLVLRPLIFTADDVPLMLDVELARANPALAAFSAVCHGDQPEVDEMFPALAEALRSVRPGKDILYHDIVLAGLPPAARLRWKAFMTAILEPHEYLSEEFRNLATEYQARGEARGEARAVLAVLDGRGIPVPAAVRDRILACTDLAQLNVWLHRVGNATTADEVIRES